MRCRYTIVHSLLIRLSKDDLFIRAWNERIQPHSDSYPRQPSKQMIESIVTNSKFSTFAAYDNFFSIITFPEYINCELIAIPDKFDFKPYAYGFQKVSQCQRQGIKRWQKLGI